MDLDLDLRALADQLEEDSRRRSPGGYSWRLKAKVPLYSESEVATAEPAPVEPLPAGEYATRPEVAPEPLPPSPAPRQPPQPDPIVVAEQEAARGRGLARLMDQGDMARVALGGGKRNPVYQQLGAEADMPVKELLGARARGQQDLRDQRAAEVHQLAQIQGRDLLEQRRKKQAQEQEDELLYGDPQSQVSQVAVSVITERMPKLGERLKGMSAKEILKLSPMIQGLLESDQRFQEARLRHKERLAEISLSGQLAGERQDERLAAQGDTDAYTGFVSMPGRSREKPERQKFRNAQAGAERVTSAVKEMLEILRQYGPERLPTEAQARLITLRQDIQYGLKDREQMGALQKAEIDRLDEMIPDSSTLPSVLKDAVGWSNTQDRLRQLGVLTNRQLVAEGLVRGLAPDQAGPYARYLDGQRLGQYAQQPQQRGQAQPSGRKRVRDTKTGKEGWWDGTSPLPAGVEVIGG